MGYYSDCNILDYETVHFVYAYQRFGGTCRLHFQDFHGENLETSSLKFYREAKSLGRTEENYDKT
jgi:hypothetical protein